MFLRSYARLSSLDACQNGSLCSTFSVSFPQSVLPGRWDRYGIFLRPRHRQPEASTGPATFDFEPREATLTLPRLQRPSQGPPSGGSARGFASFAKTAGREAPAHNN